VNGDGPAAAGLDQRDPFGDVESLAEDVDVPGGPRPGCEADDAGGHPVRQRPGLRDHIDSDVAGEPLRSTFAG
jgi:hypothetical protein